MRVLLRVLRRAVVARELWADAGHFVRIRLLGVSLLVIVAAALSALCPVALKVLVDRMAGPPAAVALSLPVLVCAYVGCQWLARAAGEARGWLYARAERRVFRSIGERLFSHVLHLPLRFHLQTQTGAVTQTLDNGLEGVQLIMHHCTFSVLPVFVELGTEVVVLGRLVSFEFLAIFCAAVICYSLTFCCAAGAITRAGRAASDARIGANAAMVDGLLNVEAVKCFTAEKPVQERVSRRLERCEDGWVLFYRRYSVSGVIACCIFAALLLATTALASAETRSGRMTIGEFVLINTYMLQLVKPIEMLGFAIQGIAQGAAMVEKMLQLFREKREAGYPAAGQFSIGTAEVAFEEVSVAYTPQRPALRRVSFRIGAGCTLGVVGASGSGKSTMVRLLMRLLDPESGVIRFGGVPIASFALADLRRAIAVVPQETLLLNDSLRNNIAFGQPAVIQEDIERAVRIARLDDFILTLPEGYETLVGERGVKLSGGERQRISIARAVLKNARMYIFDEATSSLDSCTEEQIVTGLRAISRSTTTLIIAHRLSAVIYADEIIVLEGGQVIERGTHEGLLRQGGRYAALWWSQREGSGAA